MDSVKSFFKPTAKQPKHPPKPPKKVRFDPSLPIDKKAGDKIVKLLSSESARTTKPSRKMTEKEYNQYFGRQAHNLENLRKLYNY